MRNKSKYTQQFKNGTITITKGIDTKYDWLLRIDLKNDSEGNKQFIGLDRSLFLTRKYALQYANELLTKYKLI